ncbi:MAG: DUF3192 domain-containing protein [Pseudomonadota bacterium]
MKKLPLLAAVVVSSLALQGCVVVTESGWEKGESQYDGHKQERENRDQIAALPMELSVSEVKQRLGTPDFSDRWQQEQDYQVLYYRTHRTKADGMTTRDECTPLVFVDGELTGSGELALDRVKKSR